MKYASITQLLSRGVSTLLILALVATMAMGQSLVITGGGSFAGSGTINVKGNINTNGASGDVSIPGTVNLNGTAALQQLGVTGSNALTFATLQATGSIAKQMDVNVTVTDALTVNITGGLNLDLQTKTLTLGGTSTLTLGSLDVSDALSTVVYNKAAASQTVLGLTYAGALTLSGNATKNFSASGSVAGAFSHTGGALTVDQDFTVSYATPSFATIADVSNTKTLTLSGTGAKTIAAITTITAGGAISNTGVSGLLTVTALNGNAGTISGGAGGVTFTNAATNSGDITGGAGPVTFSSTLAQGGGTILAGSGDIAFGGVVTVTGGDIRSTAAGSQLDFNANVANSAGTITLTGAGEAFFSGSLNSTGLSFASGSLVTFDGASQTIPAVTYGNLTLAGSASKTGGGSFGVAGNLIVNQDLDMFSGPYTLSFANAASTVTGTNEVIGAVSRTHNFAGTTSYAFNRAEVTAAFAALEAADMTITMRPGVSPTGVGANFVQRYYGVSSTADLSANNMDLQLYYTDAERQGTAVTLENKLGVRKYSGGSLSKYSTNGGAYTRNVGGATNTVALTKLNEGLTGVSEFALVPISYITIATGTWNATATWGTSVDDVPGATDDAEVRHTVTMGGGNRTIANLTITDDVTYDGKLSVNDADFNATTITNNGGEITVAGTRTLTVTGAFVNAAGAGSPSELVTISGIATLNSVSNSKVFTVATGGAANLTGAFTNNAGATLNTVGTGALKVTGADLTNAGSISNAGTITVE